MRIPIISPDRPALFSLQSFYEHIVDYEDEAIGGDVEPPGLCAMFHGLVVGGWISGSVTGISASSDVAVFPSMMKPLLS